MIYIRGILREAEEERYTVALLGEILDAIVLFLPAYVANMTPCLAANIYGRGHPLDLGRDFLDGRRILGDGKTLEGLISGLVAGSAVGFIFSRFLEGFALALGAMIGDIIGSFLKRRLGIERGRPAPILDQLDFVIGAILVARLLGFIYDSRTILIILVITPFLHVGANALGYLLGLKDVPY